MALAIVVGLLAAPALAHAGWFVTWGQAQRLATNNAFELCQDSSECYDWGARCQRLSAKRFVCEAWTVDFSEYGDITCSWRERIGVGYGGYLTARYVGGSMACY